MTTAAELPALLEELRARLSAAAARREALAAWVPERKMLGVIRRGPTLRRAGEAWPLGVLLLSTDGRLLGLGTATRARPASRVGYVAESARERDELRMLAAKAGFEPGEALHIDPVPLEVAALAAGSPSGPVLPGPDGMLLVRWSPAGGVEPRDLAGYLAERVELLGA